MGIENLIPEILGGMIVNGSAFLWYGSREMWAYEKLRQNLIDFGLPENHPLVNIVAKASSPIGYMMHQEIETYPVNGNAYHKALDIMLAVIKTFTILPKKIIAHWLRGNQLKSIRIYALGAEAKITGQVKVEIDVEDEVVTEYMSLKPEEVAELPKHVHALRLIGVPNGIM